MLCFNRQNELMGIDEQALDTNVGQTTNTDGEFCPVTNIYYEGFSDIILDNRSRSVGNVNLDETEVVTIAENVYYKL